MLIEAGLNDFEDFSPVVPGSYEFIIKEPVDITPNLEMQTDIGGAAYVFIVRPEIVGGDLAGKQVRCRFSNKSKGSRYFLKSFLEKIGVNIGEGGGFTSEDVLGRKFKASVGERLGTGENAGKKYAEMDTESIIAL